MLPFSLEKKASEAKANPAHHEAGTFNLSPRKVGEEVKSSPLLLSILPSSLLLGHQNPALCVGERLSPGRSDSSSVAQTGRLPSAPS